MSAEHPAASPRVIVVDGKLYVEVVVGAWMREDVYRRTYGR